MRDVTVVGAGPVGMLLAGELARRGVDVELLERRPAVGDGTRAIGIHSPVLAALEPSGLTDRLLAEAVRVRRGEARSRGRLLGTVHFDVLPARFPFVATLPQATTESVLGAAAPEPPRGAYVLAVIPHRDAVVVRAGLLGRPIESESRIVVVAGGGAARDLVYRPGAVPARDYRDRYLMTDAAADADGELAVIHLDPDGVLESFPLPGGRRRFVAWDAPGADEDPEARTRRLRDALARRGEAAAAEAVTAATSFGVRRVVAPRLRHGRVFAIGDTAHEVSPIGGQGMNLGLLDAVTLAPLLASWARTGRAPDLGLLRWEARRVQSARRAATLASVNTALGRPSGRGDVLRRTAVRAMLTGPSARLFARAYSMGFDVDA
ncbi:2-polyprenyl-6-methoxyphenol hydroxylase-like FAD-dependent oxidoreductase [Microbacterium trichothecenolyticum]|uniref:FAD-dependent oxidoreductase n=1 Tax=Microbacterium trichothecenolyticum TaxID=69370 RepID=UPI002865F204|nr:NAD(P)/FAD-dependent oxidoreductase [Microbacterium trichothecenolyticum]MDR7183961.1 2-polyprenyl-6-methoxyphenol hydroxylase-like FAD-dependent oxidoreductase [Microbacterium trichothecenolyticum]